MEFIVEKKGKNKQCDKFQMIFCSFKIQNINQTIYCKSRVQLIYNFNKKNHKKNQTNKYINEPNQSNDFEPELSDF